VDLLKVEVGMKFHGNIYLVADIISQGFHFMPAHGRRSCFNICFLVYVSLPDESRSQGIGFGLCFLPARPSQKTSLKV